jgi:transposase InsO family protein
MDGWPQTKPETPLEIRPYWSYRDEISGYDGLIFKGDRVIVPHVLRPEMLDRIHAAHLGIEKCKARARGSVFWPGMNSAIDEMVSECRTCLQFQRRNQREPLMPQEIPERPWSTVAVDIFYYKGRDYLLVVDYFSKYPEVTRINHKNSEAVILAMKEMFARHGIPEKIIADNMPFNSLRFRDFAREWEIKVVTSSPHYPRSNGLVERNVQTIKRLLKKSDDSKQDAFLALLEFRNSPISGMEQLPAELLMSRKLRAKLPIPKHLLKPKSQPVNDVRQRLRVHQLRQKAAYDQGTKQLSSLQPKELVRIRQGGVWNPAVVVEQHKSPRSYIVATSNGTQLRRNRHHLMPTNEPPMIITPPMEPVGEEERCPVISPEYRTFTSSFSSYIPEYRNRGRTRTTTFETKHKSLKGTFPID